MPGVQRQMLERDGKEVARATSIIRYAPGSHFSAHTHGGGEEFFVLEGVGQPTPPSAMMAAQFWQMQPADQKRVAIAFGRYPTSQASQPTFRSCWKAG